MGGIQARIVSKKQLTDRISAFDIAAADSSTLPPYEAGAHVLVDVGGGETRAYSLIHFKSRSSAPATYTIAVQREDGGQGGSTFMHGLKAGDPLRLSAPKNDFPLDVSAPAVLLAGGIGVTPMVSMAAELVDAGQEFTLHYAGRSETLMAYQDELRDLCGDALQVHCDDDPETRLDLARVMSGIGAANLYICGPRGMIDAACAAAENAGVPSDRVHVELFESAVVLAGDAAFEVEVASTGVVVQVAADQSIIEALEDAGLDVMYDCQRGDCGICQCDVISGIPDHRDVVLSQEERESGKVMQICVSRSKSPRLVLDI